MAKAREITGLSADDSYSAAAANIVVVRAQEVADHAPGVLDMYDIERLHDMRVATRRLRAALEMFGPCFPRKRLLRERREVKALADALGERRDRDVAIATLQELAERMGPSERAGIESLIGRLRDEQRVANNDLEPFVHVERLEGLQRRLRELVVSARSEAEA